MKKPDIVEIEEVPATNLVLLTGGKGTVGSDWLSGLTDGTVFLAKKIGDNGFVLTDFHIMNRSRQSIYLLADIRSGSGFYTDPLKFSKQFELVEILQEGE